MKKELRSRIKNYTRENKPENQTKPSVKKHLRKGPRQAAQIKHQVCRIPETQTQEPAGQQILKVQTQLCETTTDIPSNINLDHYIDDIDNHITEVDRSYNYSISQRLKNAGNIQITSDMRKILVKWLVKVGGKFRVRSETMHMCVQLIDYMLIHRGEMFNKTNFQLLGITCLFISCKYNEIYTIQSEKYVQFCDGIYTVDQLFEMESFVLLEINFNLQLPTVQQFINKFAFQYTIATEHMNFIKALADTSIFDFNTFNSFSKFELATSIAYFTSKLYKLDFLKNYLTSYKNKIEPQTFKQCFMAVMTLFKKSNLNVTPISI